MCGGGGGGMGGEGNHTDYFSLDISEHEKFFFSKFGLSNSIKLHSIFPSENIFSQHVKIWCVRQV